MLDRQELKALAVRLNEARMTLLDRYPFFGRLLVHLKFGFADCNTAYTDMENIVFCPEFVSRLSSDELRFVYLHEVMHCVLKHCIRGLSLNANLYNIACDIVVNSMILDMLQLTDFMVDGCFVMHLAPNGREGREYNAEEVYAMLLKASPQQINSVYKEGAIDTHEVWSKVDNGSLSDMWDRNIRDAYRCAGDKMTGVTGNMLRCIEDVCHSSEVSWQQLLHDYIQHDRADYVFNPTDKRYSDYDIIMPSFCENVSGSRVENIWFFIDTSGSVTDKEVSVALAEIKDAVEQIENMAGYVCCFDVKVSDPVSFDSAEDVNSLSLVGGGGTDFFAVFDYIKEIEEEKKPALVIIITDGFARYPEEEAAQGLPVIWLITNDIITPKWGEVIRLKV